MFIMIILIIEMIMVKFNPYEPDSDMDFVPFKKLMKEQWLNKKIKRII